MRTDGTSLLRIRRSGVSGPGEIGADQICGLRGTFSACEDNGSAYTQTITRSNG